MLGAFCQNKTWGAVSMAVTDRLDFLWVELAMIKMERAVNKEDGDSALRGHHLARFVLSGKQHSLPFLTNTVYR